MLIGLFMGAYFDSPSGFRQEASYAWGTGDIEVGGGVHILFLVGNRKEHVRLLKLGEGALQ